MATLPGGVLTPLLRGDDARYQVRDWENDEFGVALAGWKELRWSPLIVIEGVTVARRAAAAAFVYRIWVDAPDEVRLTRGLARDGEGHRDLWRDWMLREQAFYRADATRAAADVHIHGAPVQAHDPEREFVTSEEWP